MSELKGGAALTRFAFDITLAAVCRVEAPSLLEAHRLMRAALDCADLSQDDELVRVTEVSLLDLRKDCRLFEVDGEPWSQEA